MTRRIAVSLLLFSLVLAVPLFNYASASELPPGYGSPPPPVDPPPGAGEIIDFVIAQVVPKGFEIVAQECVTLPAGWVNWWGVAYSLVYFTIWYADQCAPQYAVWLNEEWVLIGAGPIDEGAPPSHHSLPPCVMVYSSRTY